MNGSLTIGTAHEPALLLLSVLCGYWRVFAFIDHGESHVFFGHWNFSGSITVGKSKWKYLRCAVQFVGWISDLHLEVGQFTRIDAVHDSSFFRHRGPAVRHSIRIYRETTNYRRRGRYRSSSCRGSVHEQRRRK